MLVKFVEPDCRGLMIDIEIDDMDAALGLRVCFAGVPWSVPELDIADLVEPKAAPLPVGRQNRSALSCELVSERFLLALGVSEDDRTKLTDVSVIATQ